MVYGPDIKERAFLLWVEGKTFEEIGRELGLRRWQTVGDWSSRPGPDGRTWRQRRDEIVKNAERRAAERISSALTQRLLEHDSAAQALRGAAVRSLAAELERSASPDPLSLQRIGAAMRIAVQLERLALGLPTEIRTVEEGTTSPLADLDAEQLERIVEEARAVSTHMKGDGEVK